MSFPKPEFHCLRKYSTSANSGMGKDEPEFAVTQGSRGISTCATPHVKVGRFMFYRRIARPLLFSLPPEWVHHASLAAMTRTPLGRLIEPFARREFPSLEKKLFGLTFPNPVGLAAGFDKNAEGVIVWARLWLVFLVLCWISTLSEAC